MFHKILFFLFALLIASIGYSQDIEEEVLEEILLNETSCVKNFQEGKLYLKEEKIYPTENGLFLLLNEEGKSVSLSKLSSDPSGCFVKVSEEFHHSTMYKVIKKCPGCGQRYIIRCTNEYCPLVQHYEELKKQQKQRKEDKKKKKDNQKQPEEAKKEKPKKKAKFMNIFK